MKTWFLALGLLLPPAQAIASNGLIGKVWIHGSADCSRNADPPIETYRHDADTYILRQSKCVHFEAPFIYVLFGQHTVFVLDTGATADPVRFPLYETVRSLAAQRGPQALKILVAHSHSHRDHRAGDGQFKGQPGVVVVDADAGPVRRHFGFSSWPEGSASVDLGGRALTVVPAPGHQEEAIAVHDPQTGWLLTGDNLYPGRLYVKNWNEYRSSITRLVEFSSTRALSAVMGAHIEMSRTGLLFEAGSTFQPGEASLALSADDLRRLDELLQDAGDRPREIVTEKFVVVPIGAFWRVLGGVLSLFGVR